MLHHIAKAEWNGLYWFDSQVIILLDMPVEPGPWEVIETQKPPALLTLVVVPEDDRINMRLEYDGKYSLQGVKQLGKAFVALLQALIETPSEARVQDVVKVLG